MSIVITDNDCIKLDYPSPRFTPAI